MDTVTVPTMPDKIAAQVARLGISYVPLHLVRDHVARGELVLKSTESMRAHGDVTPIFLAWRADARGKAIDWWLARLSESEVQTALLS